MISINEFQKRVSFHDSTIDNIYYEGQDIVLDVEYYDEEDVAKRVKINLRGAEVIKKNDLIVDRIIMEAEIGDIIRLESNNNVVIYLYWINYSPRTSVFCIYDISGSNMQGSVQEE